MQKSVIWLDNFDVSAKLEWASIFLMFLSREENDSHLFLVQPIIALQFRNASRLKIIR